VGERKSLAEAFAAISDPRVVGRSKYDLVEILTMAVCAMVCGVEDFARAHWGIENSVHWCLDVAFNDDHMRAREKNAGANLATVRRVVLNLFRLDKTPRKGGIYTRRILASSSDAYRSSILGLRAI